MLYGFPFSIKPCLFSYNFDIAAPFGIAPFWARPLQNRVWQIHMHPFPSCADTVVRTLHGAGRRCRFSPAGCDKDIDWSSDRETSSAADGVPGSDAAVQGQRQPEGDRHGADKTDRTSGTGSKICLI